MLNKTEEQTIVDTLQARNKIPTLVNFTTQYKQQGNFTIAIVVLKAAGRPQQICVGVSKKCPRDKVNPRIGAAVAFRRALLAIHTPEQAGMLTKLLA